MSRSTKNQEPSEFKATPALGLKIIDEDQGIVEHLISVFGVTDLGGDVVHPGAFTKTLQERAQSIRVLDAHRKESVLDAIGVSLQLKEIPREKLPAEVLKRWPEATGGLWAETQFLLDTPEGKGAFARIKAGAVKEFSFGYNTLDDDYTKDAGGLEVRNLRTIRLWEYGPILFGMNPAARVIGAKGASTSPPPVTQGDEEKPAPDVTENTIRMRVRDPGTFKEGSFRTISIDKSGGIQAVIGRPKGKTTTEIQSYIFDKTKWTVERARKWVSEHKKTFVILVLEEKEEEPGGPDKCVCPKCGHKEDKKKGVPCRSMTCSKCDTKLVADTEKDEDEKALGGGIVPEPYAARLLQLIKIEREQFELDLIGAGPD